MRRTRILGVGMYLPEREVTNTEIEAIKELETSDEWIRQRTYRSNHVAAMCMIWS